MNPSELGESATDDAIPGVESRTRLSKFHVAHHQLTTTPPSFSRCESSEMRPLGYNHQETPRLLLGKSSAWRVRPESGQTCELGGQAQAQMPSNRSIETSMPSSTTSRVVTRQLPHKA